MTGGRPSFRRLATFAAAVLALGVLSACTPEDSAADAVRGVTQEESERLAVSRFRNYELETRAFTATVPVGDQVLTLDGLVDFRDHRGIASFTTDDTPASTGLIAWRFEAKALLPTSDEIVDPLPDDGWQVATLDASATTLDAVLRILIDLGDDRAENPLLLRQNGATWLRAGSIAGEPVDWMSSAEVGEGESAPLEYAITADGTMQALILHLGTSGDRARVDWGSGSAGALPDPPSVLAD